MDYRTERRSITRAKLVTEIAKQLNKFIEVRATSSPYLRAVYELCVQNKQSDTIDPAYEEFKVGPGGIGLRHMYIASLDRVSRGSWQPRIMCSGA